MRTSDCQFRDSFSVNMEGENPHFNTHSPQNYFLSNIPSAYPDLKVLSVTILFCFNCFLINLVKCIETLTWQMNMRQNPPGCYLCISMFCLICWQGRRNRRLPFLHSLDFCDDFNITPIIINIMSFEYNILIMGC